MKAWERDPLPQMMAHPAAGSRKNIPIILTWNTEDWSFTQTEEEFVWSVWA